MATTPTPIAPVIRVIDGQAVTTSLELAEYFGKRHDDVIRKIRALDCSLEFNARNFTAVEYTDAKGENRCAYTLTRDGFFFVAMGFTGPRAAAFKEAYIEAFNAMEQQLAARPTPMALMVSQLEADGVRESVWAVMQGLSVIREAWDGQLYDGLKLLGSPLAVSLQDRIAQACWSIQTIAHATQAGTMSEALASTRPAPFPRSGHCALCAPAKPTKPTKPTKPANAATPSKAAAPRRASKKGGRRHDY